MANRPDRPLDGKPGRLGYSVAILVSALGHGAIVAFAIFVMPRLLHSENVPPPSYTVKIVDNVPAGDLGTHLPKLSSRRPPPQEKPPEPEQVAKAEEPKPPEPPPVAPPAVNDKNVLSLATASEIATPPPTPPLPPVAAPTPEPTPKPTPEKVAEATPKPAATPKPRHRPHTPKTPNPAEAHKQPRPKIVIAKADKNDVREKLAEIRRQLRKQHMEEPKNSDQDSDDDDDSGDTDTNANDASNGPVASREAISGSGYGIGEGTGSLGMLQDPEFLLYYRTVQQRIKNAWIFRGGSNDLTATVDFSIGPDGNPYDFKIAKGSGDAAFDDSVLRAIKRAAPFPPPPEKFRSEFASGIAAEFKLGELKS